MSEHSAPPVRSSGMLQANDPPIEGDVLATISVTGVSELRLVRLPGGLLALGSSDGRQLTIGTGRDMSELIKALQAVARIIGPIEGGT